MSPQGRRKIYVMIYCDYCCILISGSRLSYLIKKVFAIMSNSKEDASAKVRSNYVGVVIAFLFISALIGWASGMHTGLAGGIIIGVVIFIVLAALYFSNILVKLQDRMVERRAEKNREKE